MQYNIKTQTRMNTDKYVHSDCMKNHQVEVQTDLLPAIEQISVCVSAQICSYTETACVCVSVCVARVRAVGNSLLVRDFSLPPTCAERALEC